MAPESPQEAILHLHGNSFAYELGFSPPQRPPVRVRYTPETVDFWEGGAAVSSVEGAYEAVYVNQESLTAAIAQSTEPPVIKDRSRGCLGREPLMTQDSLLTEKLAEQIKGQDNIMTQDILLSDGKWLVRSRSHRSDLYLALGVLSSSEQLSVHLDLILSALRLRAKRNPGLPFLLILDDVLWRYDERNIERFMEVCDRLPKNVQVLIADSSGRVADQLPALRQDLVAEIKTDQPGFLIAGR